MRKLVTQMTGSVERRGERAKHNAVILGHLLHCHSIWSPAAALMDSALFLELQRRRMRRNRKVTRGRRRNDEGSKFRTPPPAMRRYFEIQCPW